MTATGKLGALTRTSSPSPSRCCGRPGPASAALRAGISNFPLLLGAGTRLFSESDKDTTRLALTEHAVYSNGIQKQVFDVVR